MVNHENDTDTQWWNSKYSDAALIDFTNPKANNWFKNRLESLKDYAELDGFKFDAGEASFTPVVKINSSDQILSIFSKQKLLSRIPN